MIQREHHTYVPIEAVTQPRDGECKVDRWWVVTPDDEIVLWRKTAPQCNSNESFIRQIQVATWPGYDVRFIPVVYLGPVNEDGRYLRPIPEGVTT